MKKILYSVALAACCMGTMTSCSDFLDASNKSNVTDKQTFATKEGFNSLVNDAYQHLQNVYAAPLFTSCFSAGTDMYADARNKMNEALNTLRDLDSRKYGYQESLYLPLCRYPCSQLCVILCTDSPS